MGKVHSKQGDCFIVNAHFNPVCHQLDEVSGPHHHRPSLASHDNNISEMSLSISRDNITMNKRIGIAEDKYPLRVILPPAECQQQPSQQQPQQHQQQQSNQGFLPSCYEEVIRPEKAEEEKSEKEERQQSRLLQKESISLTTKDLEKQEFSFTLYDFNGHGKVTKDDVSGLVRSIYDALGKTVKLPPSGSRTIKVRLAVDPDAKTPPIPLKATDTAPPEPAVFNDPPVENNPKMCCSRQASNELIHQSPSTRLGSVHTLSTYLSSGGERTDSRCPIGPWNCVPKFSEDDGGGKVEEDPLLVAEKCVHALQAQEAAKETMPAKETTPAKERGVGHRVFPATAAPSVPDRRDSMIHHRHKHHHHRYPSSNNNNRDHLPECRERRNHYLDLVGVENCGAKPEGCHHLVSPPAYNAPEPTYVCPYRILDRTHQCGSHGQNEQPLKSDNCLYDKSRSRDHVSRFLKYRFYSSAPKDDLLNLNFDLCDLVPEEKFDWECYHQHRRSKSYDMYDKKFPNQFMGSPKPKPKQFRPEEFNATSKVDLGALPSSPNHHYRHRHRERERQRAMQQVANWIEKEHLDREEGIYASPLSSRRSQMMVERHEHHHLHEHVHHHYHHYVDA